MKEILVLGMIPNNNLRNLDEHEIEALLDLLKIPKTNRSYNLEKMGYQIHNIIAPYPKDLEDMSFWRNLDIGKYEMIISLIDISNKDLKLLGFKGDAYKRLYMKGEGNSHNWTLQKPLKFQTYQKL